MPRTWQYVKGEKGCRWVDMYSTHLTHNYRVVPRSHKFTFLFWLLSPFLHLPSFPLFFKVGGEQYFSRYRRMWCLECYENMVIATKESRCAGCEQQMRNKHAAFIPSRKKNVWESSRIRKKVSTMWKFSHCSCKAMGNGFLLKEKYVNPSFVCLWMLKKLGLLFTFPGVLSHLV